MPIINSCYFSQEEIDRDNDFLASQGLNEAQQKAISLYLYHRISSSMISGFIYTTIAFLIPFLLFFFYWEEWHPHLTNVASNIFG